MVQQEEKYFVAEAIFHLEILFDIILETTIAKTLI